MIDYDKMSREFPKQKAALTRALKKGHAAVVATTRTTVAQWNETGAWPDDWARWQRALDDSWNADHARYIRGQIDDLPQRYDIDSL